jgi:hypothetical protein
MGRHVSTMGEMINTYNILIKKHERKRPLADLGIDEKIIAN